MKYAIIILIILGGGALVFLGVYSLFFAGGTSVIVEPTNTSATQPPTSISDTLNTISEEKLNDLDSDGISNEEERTLGLDATAFDTDGDGLADAFEINSTLTDPLLEDTDGDGLTDGQEFLIYNTNPTQSDTDGDGYDDNTEITNGFDPNKAA
jgi:hypothetical protein